MLLCLQKMRPVDCHARTIHKVPYLFYIYLQLLFKKFLFFIFKIIRSPPTAISIMRIHVDDFLRIFYYVAVIFIVVVTNIYHTMSLLFLHKILKKAKKSQ